MDFKWEATPAFDKLFEAELFYLVPGGGAGALLVDLVNSIQYIQDIHKVPLNQ